MATSNGPMPSVPWTCPHCQATWHSGRQYCVDCGYGMPVQPSQPWKAEALDEALVARRFSTPDPSATPQGTRLQSQAQYEEDREATLRRSLEAESALQAEVVLLRERTAQLDTRLDEQRRVFVTGVQQMMRPLQDYFRQFHMEVPFDAVVPEVLKRLAAADAVRPSQPGKTPAEVPQVARLEALIAQVAHALVDAQHRLTRLEAARQDDQDVAVNHYDPVPDSLGTFVMSDAQAAAIERAILDAQTRGRPFPGE